VSAPTLRPYTRVQLLVPAVEHHCGTRTGAWLALVASLACCEAAVLDDDETSAAWCAAALNFYPVSC